MLLYKSNIIFSIIFIWLGWGLVSTLFAQQKREEYTYSKIAYVPYTARQITINGIFSEWDSIPITSFAGFDSTTNHAVVKMMWDEENLYIAFKVYDTQLNANQLENSVDVWKDDCVELYLSTNKTQITDYFSENEHQILINVNGSVATARGKTLNKSQKQPTSRDFNWKGLVSLGVVKAGTVNNNLDIDVGYNVEMDLKLSSLGYQPRQLDTLYCDLVIEDLDSNNLSYFDWARLSLFSQPKKWNQIILTPKAINSPKTKKLTTTNHWFKYLNKAIFPALVVFTLCLSLAVYLIRNRRNKHQMLEIPQSENQIGNIVVSETHPQKLANKAMAIINQEYARDLKADEVADRLCISPRNFRRVFKQETQKTFVEMLNQARIDKAARLLKETDLQINEISFQTGFQTFVHFRRVFLAQYNCTPRIIERSLELKIPIYDNFGHICAILY